MSKCTWVDCKADATKPQTGKNGEVWANLCESHHQELESSLVTPLNPKLMLQCWVRASGGAKVMARKMTDRV